MSLTSKFKTTAKAAAISALMLGSSFNAMAENPASTSASTHNASTSSVSYSAPVKDKTPFELAEIAGKYSEENDGIGMFINIAPGTRFTPQQIGDAFVRKFAREGIEAEYTFNYASKGSSSVDFFVRGVPYTGYGFGRIEEGYELVSKTFLALQAKDLASNSLTSNDLALNN